MFRIELSIKKYSYTQPLLSQYLPRKQKIKNLVEFKGRGCLLGGALIPEEELIRGFTVPVLIDYLLYLYLCVQITTPVTLVIKNTL